jgi:Leucine-rich repeat (LRR) protein
MKEMFMPFADMVILAKQFPSLDELDLSVNALSRIPGHFQFDNLKSLALEFNYFTNLSQLSCLATLVSIESLKLKGNRISKINEPLDHSGSQSSTAQGHNLIFGIKLRFVDLSYNQINSWEFIDGLVMTFPGLKALRLSQNPIYSKTVEFGLAHTLDDPSMITVARIKALEILDYRQILPDYRANAEGFYLSLIGRELASVSEDDVSAVTSRHKRYEELCEIYESKIPRSSTNQLRILHKFRVPRWRRDRTEKCDHVARDSKII